MSLLCWANASPERALRRKCPIYLLCFFILFQLSPNSPNALPCSHPASHFILLFFYFLFIFCCWWIDSRWNRMGAHDLHKVPVIRLISGLPNSVDSHRLMSCAWHPWLVWLSFCLSTFLLPRHSRQILSLVLFLFPFFVLLLWPTLFHHQSYEE